MDNEAVRLIGDKRVRSAAMVSCLTALSAAVALWLAYSQDRPGAWYVAGMILGIMCSTWGMLLGIVALTRRRFASEDMLNESAAMLVTSISAELHRRGDEFEATWRPGSGIVIHKRGETAPDPRSLH
jgi:hypothetical protein